ncbi:MAG: ribosomal protection-like ABC-F family protein [Anaerolineaceae bacterium]
MLSVNQINKSFGLTPVLKNITFSILANERWGLVGINGSGKSTLLRILTDNEHADSGTFSFTPSKLRVGYLEQGFEFQTGDTIHSYLDKRSGNFNHLANELSELAKLMVEHPDQTDLQTRFDLILAELETNGQSQNRLESTLAGLGLDHLEMDTPISHLSGGQKTRLMLAGVLLNDPQILFLDEPTNHLDIEMLTWLENWIKRFQGGILMVSHDRTFLDHTVNGILELNEHTHQIKAYKGTYSDYIQQISSEQEKHWQAYKDQQDEIQRLRNAATEMRSKAKYHKGGKTDPQNTDGFSIGFFANRSKEVIQKAKNIEKRMEKLLTEDKIDKPTRTWQLHINFGEAQTSGRDVLILEEFVIGYPGLILLQDLNLVLQYGQRVAFIGPNGCGKTTLLKTINGEIPPLHGSFRLGSKVQVGTMSQEQSEWDGQMNALESITRISNLNETEIRSFLSKFLFRGDDVFVKLENLSYGERARLSLAHLVASGCNFLILDEPINHLDIPSRSNFEQALSHFEGTILAVVHDRYFIERFASQIWEVKDCGIQVRENK